jgi:type I restriction-modification system DNA methylase subunit
LKDATPLRILDPACGSGSFLIEAYQHLLNWYLEQYIADGPEKQARGRQPKLYQAAKGDWRLTIAERRRILLTHIYGVDIDSQAVEVTKLSLLLKVLEGEAADAIARQMDFFRMRALPDLASNIRCGNSLIGSDFYDENPRNLFNDDDQFRINDFNWPDEFSFLMSEKGFSTVIGNPPWISLTGKFRNDIYLQSERDYLVRRYAGNSRMPNMYEYFISRGLELLRPNGLFSFIVPDRFGYNDQFILLRKQIMREFTLEEMLYRAPFPNVTADTAIFRIAASKPTPEQKARIGEFGGNVGTIGIRENNL